MRDFVDCEEKVVIRRPTDDIRAKEEPRRQNVCFAKREGTAELKKHYSQDNPLREGFIAHQLHNLYNSTNDIFNLSRA